MLHGTGGNEHDLVPLAAELMPGAGVLSPRGKVLERGMPRFFRRLAEGVFDLDDLRQRTLELADFVGEASAHYKFDASRVIAVGFSNGANVAGSRRCCWRPGFSHGAVLFRAMVPHRARSAPAIPATPVLISNGRVDPLVPVAETDRLAALLRSAGAQRVRRSGSRPGISSCTTTSRRRMTGCARSSEITVSEQFSSFEYELATLRRGMRRRAMAVLVAIVARAAVVRARARRCAAGHRAGLSGQQLYEPACAACHGTDGRGQPIAVRGFDTEPPDFTDCQPDDSRSRSRLVLGDSSTAARFARFDAMMPAFGDELSDAEIGKLIGHVRGFCTERGWPHGDLNMPRPFVTEKAYPENEAVLTTTFARGSERAAVSTEFLYEHRVGRRGQYEIFVPRRRMRSAARTSTSSSTAIAADRSFRAVARSRFNNGGAVFEAFATLSQALPLVTDGFLHAHAGIETPTEQTRPERSVLAHGDREELSWSARWGRAWSPMVELLAAREMVVGRGRSNGTCCRRCRSA